MIRVKEPNERLSPKTKRELIGLYTPTYGNHGCVPIISSKEPLTSENFGLVENDVIYTANDFRWYEEDGSCRDFRYGDNQYLESSAVPDEVSRLLNTLIGVKFATQQMEKAKIPYSLYECHQVQKEFLNAQFIFRKHTDKIEKLYTAQTALADIQQTEVANILRDILKEITE